MKEEKWYERVAKDPKGAIQRRADRLGMTVEQMDEHMNIISTLVAGTEQDIEKLAASMDISVEELKTKYSVE